MLEGQQGGILTSQRLNTSGLNQATKGPSLIGGASLLSQERACSGSRTGGCRATARVLVLLLVVACFGACLPGQQDTKQWEVINPLKGLITSSLTTSNSSTGEEVTLVGVCLLGSTEVLVEWQSSLLVAANKYEVGKREVKFRFSEDLIVTAKGTVGGRQQDIAVHRWGRALCCVSWRAPSRSSS